MADDFKVIIIGAGLAGLSIAHGLRKNGVPFGILEKEPTPRDRAWGVTISWSHPLIAQLLPAELYARLPECQPDPWLNLSDRGLHEGVMLRDGATGEAMVNPLFPGIRRLNLQKTRRVWAEGIPVQYGKNVTSIELPDGGGVIAHFADGTSERGSVLIGTDGGGSLVRKFLCGPRSEPQVLPYEFLNFPIQYTAEQARHIDRIMHPIVDVGVHPKGMYIGIFLLDKPDKDRPETWIFYILCTWPKEEGRAYDKDEDMLPELRKRSADYADPFKCAVDWIPEGTRVRIVPGGFRVWKTDKWNNRDGRVTLAGDAAHSMTFHRGQGGNNAIKDCARFVNAMVNVKEGKMSLKEAIEAYDDEVVERGANEVEISNVQTEATHKYETYKNSPVAKYGINPIQAKKEAAKTA